MKNVFKRDKRTELEAVIDEELLYLAQAIQSQKIDEYTTLEKFHADKKEKMQDLAQLVELSEKQQKIKETARSRVSPDAVIGGLFPLIGILVMLYKEDLGQIITSKAFSLIKFRGRT